jgi:serine/threonine protein kinase
VINGNYGYECDLWSLGVLLYVMLIGKFPFKGDTVSETLEKVSIGKINYSGEEWEDISLPAKTLVRQLLQKDPKKRLNAS